MKPSRSPLAATAHGATNRAIANGTLVRSDECASCGVTASGWIERLEQRNRDQGERHWVPAYRAQPDYVVDGWGPARGRYVMVAHHEDYARPLDVEWLCVSCHKRRVHAPHA